MSLIESKSCFSWRAPCTLRRNNSTTQVSLSSMSAACLTGYPVKHTEGGTWIWSSVSGCVPSTPPWMPSWLYLALGHGHRQTVLPHSPKPDQWQSELPEMRTHWDWWENLWEQRNTAPCIRSMRCQTRQISVPILWLSLQCTAEGMVCAKISPDILLQSLEKVFSTREEKLWWTVTEHRDHITRCTLCLLWMSDL